MPNLEKDKTSEYPQKLTSKLWIMNKTGCPKCQKAVRILKDGPNGKKEYFDEHNNHRGYICSQSGCTAS